MRRDIFVRIDRVMVLNESLAPAGKAAGGMFDFLYEQPRFEQMADSARTVTMPRLACMKAMRDEGLTFYEAAEGKRGKAADRCRLAISSWSRPGSTGWKRTCPRSRTGCHERGAHASGPPREGSRGGRKDGRGPSGGGLRRARLARHVRPLAARIGRGPWRHPSRSREDDGGAGRDRLRADRRGVAAVS